MKNELVLKTIRCFIIAFCFLCLTTIVGIDRREAHQFIFMLGTIVLFGLLLKNVWLTLFLWWTVFLFCFTKFNLGSIYLQNVFFGCILYYLVKLAFRKEHINLFINAMLWVVFLNIVYCSVQVLNMDFIFVSQGRAEGFMGVRAFMGVLMALAVPLLATRGTKMAYVACFGLFVPLYLAMASTAMGAAIIGLMFVLWFKMKRKLWIALTVVLLVTGVCYITFVDMANQTVMRIHQWKMVLKDCIIHPITGWGLDSFRRTTEKKPFLYTKSFKKIENTNDYQWLYWDNPHNLYISIFYEFGIIAIFLLGGYIRQCAIWFGRAVKSPNTLALAGFGLVFFIVSIAHFPLHLARFCVLIIPAFAMYEISVR